MFKGGIHLFKTLGYKTYKTARASNNKRMRPQFVLAVKNEKKITTKFT